MNRIEKIRTILEQSFRPHQLEIIDESHLHVGHQGAKSGKGHFKVLVKISLIELTLYCDLMCLVSM